MFLLIFLLFTTAASLIVSNSLLAVNVKKTSQYITSSQDTVIVYDTLETPSIGSQDFTWSSGVATCSSSGFYLIYVEISFLDSNAQTVVVSVNIDGISQGRQLCNGIILIGLQTAPAVCSFIVHEYITAGQNLSVQITTESNITIKSKLAAYKTTTV